MRGKSPISYDDVLLSQDSGGEIWISSPVIREKKFRFQNAEKSKETSGGHKMIITPFFKIVLLPK